MKLNFVQSFAKPCLLSVGFVYLIPVIFCGESAPDLELQLVQVLFRHGDRNPINSYPNDPYKNESFWPEGFAQLTKRGKQQQYRLGKFLRNRYNNFLSQRYSPNEIFVESTDIDRTLMSAEANLAGLYPPQDPLSLWNPSIQWQPIPIHTRPNNTENKLKIGRACPKLDRVTEEFMESPFMVQVTKENQDLYDYLTNNSGETINDLQKLDYLYDVLHIESLYNFTLPEWTKKVFPTERFFNLTALSFKVLTYTHEMQRLRIGPLLKDIVHKMKRKVNGSEGRKMFLYSAHDTTVASLLNTLEVFNDMPPPYASAVIMELWKNTSSQQYYFKVNFRNDTESASDPYAFTIPGCNFTLCPLETFEKLMEPKIPEDWEAECKGGFFGLVGFSLGALIVATFLSVILIVSMLVMAIIRRRKNLQKQAYPYLHLQMEDEDA